MLLRYKFWLIKEQHSYSLIIIPVGADIIIKKTETAI